jgi:hypothetical protein
MLQSGTILIRFYCVRLTYSEDLKKRHSPKSVSLRTLAAACGWEMAIRGSHGGVREKVGHGSEKFK